MKPGVSMKNAIITGATGMVGGIVLRHCLQSDRIAKVTSLVRRPSGIAHPKLDEIICRDFLDYRGLERRFSGQHIAYYCLGVYTGQVPDEEFRKITVDYTRAFADLLKERSPGAAFCFLSGSGADPTGKSRFSFARYKGMAENHLVDKKYGALAIFRPAYIYPVEKRREPNITYRLTRLLYPLIRLLGNNYSITSAELGGAMFRAGIDPVEKTVLENRDILAVLERKECS